MKRRRFFQLSMVSGLGFPFFSFTPQSQQLKKNEMRDVFSMNKNKVHFYIKSDVKPVRIFHITDTHLAFTDDRENPFRIYSDRMGKAYKLNKHFVTGEEITCIQGFEQTLQKAKEYEADFLALTGDIFSFPSEAAVEWVLQKLMETNIPFGYIAGNHDWHYEGMKGSSFQLRQIWANKRLKPMYQGNDYLFADYEIKGVRMIFIDNSTYEIEPEQLEYFRQESASGVPMILFMHIPLYMPGRSMGYGCANPKWGEESDKGFGIEKREKWRSGGHTRTTILFYDEVFKAQNLLAVFAGHTHQLAMDVKNNIPQIVSGHNATGNYTEINITGN
jgi:3',5'-cyclic AMP phosphodiesterase CpdA